MVAKRNVRVEGKDLYTFKTGKAPAGRGNWAFEIAGKTYFFNAMFSQAVKMAQAVAAEWNIRSVKVLA